MNTISISQEKYGPWALVTGASSGIGAEFARQIAADKVSVVIVARRQERLNRLAEEIRGRFDVNVKVVVADLTADSGIEAIKRETEDLEIGLLVNNAGREDSGNFLDTPVEAALDTLNLNTKAPLELTHHFARRMADRGKGGIIFLSSIVAFQGVPYIANYAATKAYNLIFAESLAAELKRHNVDVVAAAPGFTDTELSPDFDFTGLPMKPMSPPAVVRIALGALGRRNVAVPGMVNKALYYFGKYLLPRVANTASFAKVFRAVLRGKLRQDGADKLLETRGLRSVSGS
ncbi:MAG: SDR family NAD(P)-dependent oxidoreductase [Pseudomonadales bacterium]